MMRDVVCDVCGVEATDETGWLIKEPGPRPDLFILRSLTMCPDCFAVKDELKWHQCPQCFNQKTAMVKLRGKWMWAGEGKEVYYCPYCGENLLRIGHPIYMIVEL